MWMDKLELEPYSSSCYDFTDENGERHRVTRILAPIRIQWEDKAIVVSWACNWGNSCHCKGCRYAKADFQE